MDLFPQSKDFADNSKRTESGKDHPLVIVGENALNAMSQTEFNKKYKSYEERYTAILDRTTKLQEKSKRRKDHAVSIGHLCSNSTKPKTL